MWNLCIPLYVFLFILIGMQYSIMGQHCNLVTWQTIDIYLYILALAYYKSFHYEAFNTSISVN